MERGWIYVLKLENDCWYVGWTKDPRKRTGKHFHNPRIEWVRRNRALDIAYQFYGTKRDEHLATLQLAHVFGIDKVRGGSYCVTDQPYKQENLPKTCNLVIGDEFWLDAIYDDRYLASQVSQQNLT